MTGQKAEVIATGSSNGKMNTLHTTYKESVESTIRYLFARSISSRRCLNGGGTRLLALALLAHLVPAEATLNGNGRALASLMVLADGFFLQSSAETSKCVCVCVHVLLCTRLCLNGGGARLLALALLVPAFSCRAAHGDV